MRRLSWISLVLCVAVAGSAHAVSLTFTGITGNSLSNTLAGEAQLSVDVTDAGFELALFTFLNVGPDPMSITDIYFDDGSLLTIGSVDNSDPGVDFKVGGAPPDLPGGKTLTPPFVATSAFTTSSSSPTQPNGVNTGESVGITFQLVSGMDFDDVLAFLTDGGLRIGLKVQGFADGGSESFVNLPQPVPEPSTALSLCMFGLVGLAFARHRG